MRSSRPKVLHAIGGAPLIAHVLTAVREVGGATAVVVGPNAEVLTEAVEELMPSAEIAVQRERRGTAHAVLAAKDAIARGHDDVLVLFADTPLVQAETLAKLRAAVADGAAVAVLGFRAANPTGYGRLITKDGELIAIREHKDTSAAEREITLCNGGLMALRGDQALAILTRIGNQNAQGEYYLTDAVAIAREMGLRAVALEAPEEEVHGVNSQAQLAQAEALLQRRLRGAALDAGVCMVAPDTVHFCADTKLGRDVVIEPYVVFGPGVVVEDGARLRSFSHLEGARVGPGAAIGPFARLRPGARLGAKVRIGNFVEVKEADIEDGVGRQPPVLYRRRAGGRGHEHRRRHHHLQLRWLRQAPHRDRCGSVHRLQLVFGRAGQDRRPRLCGLGFGGHGRRAARRAGRRPRSSSCQGRLGKRVACRPCGSAQEDAPQGLTTWHTL